MEVYIPDSVNWAIRADDGNTYEDNNVLSQAKMIKAWLKHTIRTVHSESNVN